MSTSQTPIKTPKFLRLDRSSKRDLEVHAELDRVLWSQAGLWAYRPPVMTIACSNRPGLAFSATSTAYTYAITPWGYSRDSAAHKRLDAAQQVLKNAGYEVSRS